MRLSVLVLTLAVQLVSLHCFGAVVVTDCADLIRTVTSAGTQGSVGSASFLVTIRQLNQFPYLSYRSNGKGDGVAARLSQSVRFVVVDRPDPQNWILRDDGRLGPAFFGTDIVFSQLGALFSAHAYWKQGVVDSADSANRQFFRDHDGMTARSIHVSSVSETEEEEYDQEIFEVLPTSLRPMTPLRYAKLYANSRIVPRMDSSGKKYRLSFEETLDRDLIDELLPGTTQAYEISRHFMRGDALTNFAHTWKVVERLLADKYLTDPNTPIFISDDMESKTRLWKSWGFKEITKRTSSSGMTLTILVTSARDLKLKLDEKAAEFAQRFRLSNATYRRTIDQRQVLFEAAGSLIAPSFKTFRISASGIGSGARYQVEWELRNGESFTTEATWEVQRTEPSSVKFRILTTTPGGEAIEFLLVRPVLKSIRMTRLRQSDPLPVDSRRDTLERVRIELSTESVGGFSFREYTVSDEHGDENQVQETQVSTDDFVLSDQILRLANRHGSDLRFTSEFCIRGDCASLSPFGQTIDGDLLKAGEAFEVQFYQSLQGSTAPLTRHGLSELIPRNLMEVFRLEQSLSQVAYPVRVFTAEK